MKTVVMLALAFASVAALAKQTPQSTQSVLFACADDKYRAIIVERINGEDVATVQLGAAIQVDHRPVVRAPSIDTQISFKDAAVEITFPRMQPAYIAPDYAYVAGTMKVAGFDDKEVNLFCWRGPLFKTIFSN